MQRSKITYQISPESFIYEGSVKQNLSEMTYFNGFRILLEFCQQVIAEVYTRI
jgi:hypothetical protein